VAALLVPGFPLHVCDSRYNDCNRAFVKIKNWNSCVPEEVRKSTEFMPIYPSEKTVYPVVLASPFLAQGVVGKRVSKCPGRGGLYCPPLIPAGIRRNPAESGQFPEFRRNEIWQRDLPN
jgi:hypothetical protein